MQTLFLFLVVAAAAIAAELHLPVYVRAAAPDLFPFDHRQVAACEAGIRRGRPPRIGAGMALALAASLGPRVDVFALDVAVLVCAVFWCVWLVTAIAKSRREALAR